MTGDEKERLVNKITDEVVLSKKHIYALKEAASLLLTEDPGNRDGLRELIKAKSANERELKTALFKLNTLERALRRINDVDFGLCYICEKPIPFARLLEMPGVSRCAKCEDK